MTRPIEIPPTMFEALPDYEAEALSAIKADCEALSSHPWEFGPPPPSLAGMRPAEIHAKYVVGREPFPDQAAAEYVRSELQYMLLSWSRSLVEAAKALADDSVARKSPKRAENKKRLVIHHIGKGDYSKPAELACRVNAELLVRPELARKYGLPAPEKYIRGKRKPKAITDLIVLIKNMKRAGPILASQADLDEVEYDFAFVGFEVEEIDELDQV